MNARPDTHPTDAVLQGFALGKLDDSAIGPVMEHLEDCTDCRRRVAELPDDSFAGRIRAARSPDGTPAPPDAALRAAHLASKTLPQAAAAVPGVPPELVGLRGYEIVKKLGEGGMGVVYLARNTLMDRQEVLKVMNQSLVGRPAAVERFLQEIRSAARLIHPNVATALSVHTLGDLLVLAMEYVEGEDLAKVVRSRGALPVQNACYCVHQVALGLQRGYELGLVHRDIKPGNILLSRQGKQPIVKIVDFGLAKAKTEVPLERELTGTNQMMGTPGYSAPEQLNDAKTADTRSDIYALGCTLYCLLAGESPFKGNSALAIALAQETSAVRPLRESRPEVPAELADVVAKMMSKDPGGRFQEPREVAAALVPFIKSRAKPDAKAGSALALVAGSPAKDEASPFAELVDPSVLPRKAKGARESTKPVPAVWYRRWPVLAGAGVLLLALVGMLASGVIKVRTPNGTIVLNNLPADAEVAVDGDKVIVKWGDGGKTAQISVPPGRHKIEVSKDGVKVSGEEVEIDAGERRPILVTLQPKSAPAEKQPPPAPERAADDKGFVSLFNGKDLSGWSVDGGPPGQWVTEGNTIVGQSKHFSTRNYLLTEKDYADFILRFDFKVEDGSHGGIAIRAIEGEKMPLNNNLVFDHPLIKLTNPAMEDREPTGMTHWLKNAAAYWQPVEILNLPTGIWHRMEVTVRGDNCKATADDKKLVDVTLDPDARNNANFEPGLERRKGKVGFQINTGILRFRKIEIKELPATKTALPRAESPVVVIDTSMGAIKVELLPDKAPVSVKNFLDYVDDKFYDGTLFHRVIQNLVIQGGGMLPGFVEKKTKAPIKNESSNGLRNKRGSIAMARTTDPDSATSQFFINTEDNDNFDKALARVGYCVFGKVVEGMDVVDQIRVVEVAKHGIHEGVPTEDVVIKSIRPAAPPKDAAEAEPTEVSTPSGLKYFDEKIGDGVEAKQGATVTIHYTGWLKDGKKFDSSLDGKKPFAFRLDANAVIKGWDEGVTGMKAGGRRRLIIPPHLGYGAKGTDNGAIPPNATLVFQVELLEVR